MNPTPREDVRMWRPRDSRRLLMMHGTTSSYAVEPDGAYVVGLIVRGGLRARRGGARHLLHQGDLCVWDPSGCAEVEQVAERLEREPDEQAADAESTVDPILGGGEPGRRIRCPSTTCGAER
jgi:hypothetical protein